MAKQIITNFSIATLLEIVKKLSKNYTHCDIEFDIEKRDIGFLPTVRIGEKGLLPPSRNKEDEDLDNLAETA